MVTPDRYHRQRLVDGIGDSGQEAICNSCVAIIGVGALGCMSASILARAGVGNITLIDRDIVEVTNLQRQILFTEADAVEHRPKAIAAAAHLQEINSDITITPHVEDLSTKNVERLLAGSQVIVDGLDNFHSRYLLNDFAVRSEIPYMFAGVIAGQGNVMTILPKDRATPCLRCLFPEPPPTGSQETCDTAGILAPAVGIAAACQTMDVIKFLTGNQQAISPTLLTFDLWNSDSNRLSFGEPVSNCPCCGLRQFAFLDSAGTPEAALLCGRNAVQIPNNGEFDFPSVVRKLSKHGDFVASDVVIRGTLREEQGADGNSITLMCFHDGRVIVHGTQDIGRAKAICDRFIGS